MALHSARNSAFMRDQNERLVACFGPSIGPAPKRSPPAAAIPKNLGWVVQLGDEGQHFFLESLKLFGRLISQASDSQ
jgi:hypothetical protein